MLVRAYYSEVCLLHQQFNGEYHRTARDLEYKAFGEFLVVLRRSRIELYEDYVCFIIPRSNRLLTHAYRAFHLENG